MGVRIVSYSPARVDEPKGLSATASLDNGVASLGLMAVVMAVGLFLTPARA